MVITQIDAVTFETKVRGTKFTINHLGENGWRVYSENAASKAWNSFPSKDFGSIEQIEASYKSLRGLAHALLLTVLPAANQLAA